MSIVPHHKILKRNIADNKMDQPNSQAKPEFTARKLGLLFVSLLLALRQLCWLFS
jgi:hypothetical protein